MVCMLVYSKDPNSGWVQKNVQGGKSLQIYKCPGWNKNYYIKMSWVIIGILDNFENLLNGGYQIRGYWLVKCSWKKISGQNH